METHFFSVSAAFLVIASAASAQGEWKSLFNGKDLSGWTVTVDKLPVGQDPDRIVQVRDGAIHMYADSDPTMKVPFGVITSDGSYSRFHLALEYRWLEKKFAPRKDAIRDAGLLYHASNTAKIWPPSVEYQIQEGDSGDIIFIGESGYSWAHPDPDQAPQGQGDASLLPENGGFLRKAKNQTYFGRFPEYDHAGWNRSEVIVHADESAEHILNGHVRSRLEGMQHLTGGALKEGKLCLQFEGAEIQYRKIEIRELEEPLRPDKSLLSLSAVKDRLARSGTITVKNPLKHSLPAEVSITGKDAGAFSATSGKMELAPGESMEVTVNFRPTHGADRYSAGLRIGTPESGAFVILQGIGLAAFEGKNEPSLQSVVHALGMPLDVGGAKLELDTKPDTIGESKDVPYFAKAGEGKVRITPLARFSPPGATPFGIVAKGSTALVESGKLADSMAVPDAHQSLLPPLEGGASSVEIEAPAEGFAFYLNAHQYVSFTDPGLPTEAKIARTARVYPASRIAGRDLKDAFVVGFEEAANGDYQDALFLLENVKPAP
ncbi:DUF1080 domain-containing protein [Luteolibacter arcticus]|uniref:DUF1080 domain-containing protein n=1 Tax=Luteolibacter arcticus TaxID=1581411 RepID=A0ABT3GIK6_9BACT|nr:family 16 glycoside hydrolase [Luteolibacter arcticus]MCW1923326.1 DUF1080 domain-containing protein [Luteolibacter arcticus]